MNLNAVITWLENGCNVADAIKELKLMQQASKPLTDQALQVARLHFGYAPGNYSNTCLRCKKQMEWVDKRCHVCAECADKSIAAHGITGEEA